MKLVHAFALLLVFGVVACSTSGSDHANESIRRTSDAGTDSGCGDIVLSPGGPLAKPCVHEVPNGAFVSFDDAGGTTVSVNGTVVERYPPCPCKLPVTRP